MTDSITPPVGGHTPGPWRVERQRHHFQIMHDQRGKGDGYNNRVAETVQWSPATGPQTGPTEAEANARLIAAAPDLLAVDREMLPKNISLTNPNWTDATVVPIDITMGELRRIAAAISKATGVHPHE